MSVATPRRRRTAGTGLAALALAGGSLLTLAAPAAHAGTGTPCYQTGCDGIDPTASYNSHNGSECSTGSSTVAQKTPTIGGTLQLRGGTGCGTRWARYYVANSSHTYSIYVQDGETGAWAGTGMYNEYQFPGSQGYGYSDQIFPTSGPFGTYARACVTDVTTGDSDCVSG